MRPTRMNASLHRIRSHRIVSISILRYSIVSLLAIATLLHVCSSPNILSASLTSVSSGNFEGVIAPRISFFPLLTVDAAVIRDIEGEMHMFDDADLFPSNTKRVDSSNESMTHSSSDEPFFTTAAQALVHAFRHLKSDINAVIMVDELSASAADAGARGRARASAELAASRIHPRSRVPSQIRRMQESYRLRHSSLAPHSMVMTTARFSSLFALVIVGVLLICCGAAIFTMWRRKEQREEAEQEEQRRRSAAAWTAAHPDAASAFQMQPMTKEPMWESARPQSMPGSAYAAGQQLPYDPRFSQQQVPAQSMGGPAYAYGPGAVPYAPTGYPPPSVGYPPSSAAPSTASRFGGVGGMAASGLGGLALGSLLGHGIGRMGGLGGGGWNGGRGYGDDRRGDFAADQGGWSGGGGGGGGEFDAEVGPSMADVDLGGGGGDFDAES